MAKTRKSTGRPTQRSTAAATSRASTRSVRHFDPSRPFRGRATLGEGVALCVDTTGRHAGVLRFVSEWENGEEREAARVRPLHVMPAWSDAAPGQGEPVCAVELGEGLRARVTKCGSLYVWSLLAAWADGEEKELYRVRFGEDPTKAVTYAKGAVVKLARHQRAVTPGRRYSVPDPVVLRTGSAPAP